MHRLDRSRRRLAIALSGLAGFVDASGFVANGGYFISFMSGNSTRMAVDMVTHLHRALVPAGLILGFVLGVALGTVVAARAGAARKVAVLGMVCALLGVGAAAQGTIVAQGALVLAMGALNATFQRDGEGTLALTYVTGALVKAGQALGAAAQGQKMPGAGASLALWLGLVLGGIAGAAMGMNMPQAGLWLGAGWALAGTIAAYRITR
jgi:uncharacterized membrane protein YoaK (UPF0700 family)